MMNFNVAAKSKDQANHGLAPYFYIIQHRPTGRRYAGYRGAADCSSTELLKEGGYFTSSKVVKALIESEGLSAFKIERIREFDDAADAYAYEIRFLKRIGAAKNPNWLNQRDVAGTRGCAGITYEKAYGTNKAKKLKKIRSDSVKKVRSKKYWASPNSSARRLVNEGTHNFLGGAIQKASCDRLIAAGTHHLLGPSANAKMIEKGIHPTQTIKVCEYCEKKVNSPNYSRWHGERCKSYAA